MSEPYHTKGNRHLNGEFEVYRVVMGEVAFIQTSPQLKDSSVTIAGEGDMFNVIPYYFHRAINISSKEILVTSDIRPMDTKTSYSPVDEKGFPLNILLDKNKGLLLQRKNGERVPLTPDLPEGLSVIHHSQITINKSLIQEIIKDARENKLPLEKPYKNSGYIVSGVRKVSEMKEFYLNREAARKINDIAYITLDGRLEEINIINGLTIIMPGAVPL